MNTCVAEGMVAKRGTTDGSLFRARGGSLKMLREGLLMGHYLERGGSLKILQFLPSIFGKE